MTKFDGYEEIDLYESQLRDVEDIWKVFNEKIEDIKNIFSIRQIKLLRSLIHIELAQGKADIERLNKELQTSYEVEIRNIMK
jgi:hypothetical protein